MRNDSWTRRKQQRPMMPGNNRVGAGQVAANVLMAETPHVDLCGSGHGLPSRCVSTTTSVPQIAADLLQRPNRQSWPSRPGEFHPEPLTDPDLNLSIHPARVTARRLPPSAEPSGSSRFDPVGPRSTTMTHPLRSMGIAPLRRYYEAVRPSPALRYFQPHGWSRLCFFPWHRRPGSHVPYKSQIELRAASMPDAAWAVSGHPPS